MTVNQHNQIVWCTKRLFLHFTGTMSDGGWYEVHTLGSHRPIATLNAGETFKVTRQAGVVNSTQWNGRSYTKAIQPWLWVETWQTGKHKTRSTHTTLWGTKILVPISVHELIMSKPHKIPWQVRTRTVWNIHKKYKISYQTFLSASLHPASNASKCTSCLEIYTETRWKKTQRSHSITDFNK